MIYFVADTHFHHNNIIKYCNRPFKDVDEMNEILINNWNSVVTNEDTIYHLGDFCLSNTEEIKKIFNRLNGNKILIRGNHDRKPAIFYEKLGFKVLTNAPIILDEYKLMLSHKPLPDNLILDGYINLHGHIHEKELDNTYKYSTHINLSVDVTCFKPVSLEEINKLRNNN